MMGQSCTFRSKFANDTKLGRVADTPEGHAAIQKYLDRLEKWTDRNLEKFKKENFYSFLQYPKQFFHHHNLLFHVAY